MNINEKFWNENFEKGYYDKLISSGLLNGRNFQANWHNCTYLYVKKYINQRDNHLDYACGSGTFIGRYLYSNSVGIDISKDQIDYALETFGNKNNFYVINEFEKIKKQKFDVVTVLGLIEFLKEEDINNLLKRLNELINEDGRIIITTPNFSSIFVIIQKISRFFGVKNYENVTITKLTKKSLRGLLEKHYSDVVIKKIINPGLLLSILNNNLGIFAENFLGRLLLNKFGFILLATVKK